MTETMQATYERALKRAHDEHLEITLLESWGAHVRNPKYATGYYTVRFYDPMPSTCNCEAGQRSVYCKHRAIVHEARVAAETEREPAKTEREPARLNWSGMTRDERAEWLAERESEERGFLSDPDYQNFLRQQTEHARLYATVPARESVEDISGWRGAC